MKKRTLGSNGPKISAIGLGCMGIAEFYGHTSRNKADRTLHKAIELGVNLLDTADMYGRGLSEEYVGKAIRSCRAQIVLSTKFGFIRTDNDINNMQLNGSPAYVRIACENSLRRLKTDYIDIYFLHRVDPKVPIEDTIGAMRELVLAGKIRYIGLSDTTITNLERAAKVHPIHAYQGEYSLWHREPEIELLTCCQKLGISFMPYSPLGRGFLTGKLKDTNNLAANDFRKMLPRFQDENYHHNLQLINKIETIATEKNCTLAQLALAWLLAQAPDILPIPGATLPSHVEENVAAVNTILTNHDLARLNKIMPIGSAKGAQYPEMNVR